MEISGFDKLTAKWLTLFGSHSPSPPIWCSAEGVDSFAFLE